MKQMKENGWKGIKAVVIAFVLFVVMIPVSNVWADVGQDNEPPVIESVVFEGDGQTFTINDSFQFVISVYDIDSEIGYMSIRMRTESGNHVVNVGSEAVKIGENLYALTIDVPSEYQEEWQIYEVSVSDNADNWSYYEVDYSVFIERLYDSNTVFHLSASKNEVVFDENNLSEELYFEGTVENNKKEISWISCYLEGSDEDRMQFSVDDYDQDGVFHGSIGLDSIFYQKNNVYVLKDVRVIYTDNTEAYLENVPEYICEVKNNIEDKEDPIITNVTMDKKGQYVESGEVEITLDMFCESGLRDTVAVMLESTTEQEHLLELNAVTMSEDAKYATYAATVNVNELHACEWFISRIGFKGIYGNYIFYYGGYEAEYYFYVYRDGFVEDNKIYSDVTLRMFDANDNVIATINGDVPRRSKLGDVFGDKWVEKLPDDEELGKFLGWVVDDKFVTKDSMMFIDSNYTYINIEPKYEKKKVEITYRYLYNKAYRSSYEEIMIEEDSTYGEVMDMIECPKADGYTFTGWLTSYDEEAVVKEDYLDLYAEYDKYPIHLIIAYLDKNGILNSIDTIKDYPAGMTYNQILSECNPDVDKWLYSNMMWDDYDSKIGIREGLTIEANAEDEDKQIVQYEFSWIKDSEESEEYGEFTSVIDYIVVDKETALLKDSLVEIVKSVVNANHFDKLTCSDYYVYTLDYNDDGYVDSISLDSAYEDSFVNLYGYDKDWELIFDQYYVVNPGETFYLPEEYEGKKVYWHTDEGITPYGYYTGSITIPAEDEKGCWYYLSMETELPEDAILHENPSKPIEPEKPAIVAGWKKDNVGWWYQNADGTYPSNCWKMIAGKWYAFDARGYMREGWFYDAGKWYYLVPGSGQMAIGWVQVGGTWYYMNSSGAMVTGWVKDGNTWYYMKSSGAMATGWIKDGSTWYYMKSTGAMATGWVKDGNTWYYMKSTGAMATGWVKDGNTWYYMKSTGAMATGWIQDGGTWYYLNSSGAWVA